MSRQEDDEQLSFRPKMSGSARRERVPGIGSLSRLVKSARGGHVTRGSRAPYVKPEPQFSRRVTVKARIVKMNAYGKRAARMHMSYLERESVSMDGGKGEIYGRDPEMQRDDWQTVLPDEPHQFRFIVSPEDEVDLTSFTRELMQHMEKDLDRELDWVAVNHYNTDHPHTHILVHGLDKEGREVIIDREYMSNGFRRRAGAILTRELGTRDLDDLQQQIDRDIERVGVTGMDRKLGELEEGQVIDTKGDAFMQEGKFSRDKLLRRLRVLEKMGFATEQRQGTWQMREGWQKTLRAESVRQRRFRDMHRVIGGDPSRYREYGTDHGTIEGKLVRIGLDDELYGRKSWIVEDPRGEVYYVVRDGSTGKDRDLAREGDVVKISMVKDSWSRPSDASIAEQAEKHGGVYDRNRHLMEINGTHIRLRTGKMVPKEEYIDALEKRLERLSSMGLAEEAGKGVWRIAPDMQTVLARKDTEEPRFKQTVTRDTALRFNEQETYRGRTWLDRFTANPDKGSAHYGFGKEVQQAARRRALFLQEELGIDPLGASRARQLDQVEQKDLAQTISGRERLKYQEPENLQKVKGSVDDSGTLPSGKRYAIIKDPRARSFTLLPWRREFEKSTGKQIEVIRNQANNRWMVRQLQKGMGR